MTHIAYYPRSPDDMRKMQDVQRRGAGSYPFNLRPENVVTLNQIKAEAVREYQSALINRIADDLDAYTYRLVFNFGKYYADKLEKGDEHL